ncbi:hypothetical protein V1264_005651 [Littorina saxatilis]|uniref:Uncharacterized protein n=1 Tax=Littorina saxatilis TaxID=31220 RepID=A0AAN9G6C5_9CAEN
MFPGLTPTKDGGKRKGPTQGRDGCLALAPVQRATRARGGSKGSHGVSLEIQLDHYVSVLAVSAAVVGLFSCAGSSQSVVLWHVSLHGKTRLKMQPAVFGYMGKPG